MKCATDVFKSNTPFLTGAEETTSAHQSAAPCDGQDNPQSFLSGLPSLKVFLAGKTVGVSMLQRATVSHDLPEAQSDFSRQITTPLVHALVYNPFVTVQVNQECVVWELSCFNVTALYSQQPAPVGKSIN